MDVVREIKDKIKAGTVIPKPDAKKDFIVKGWGKRRNEEALIYQIPNHKNIDKPYEKGINATEWHKAYRRILYGENFDREWFEENMAKCAEEGDCNFTTIGGIFMLLGLVDYEYGVFKPRKKL